MDNLLAESDYDSTVLPVQIFAGDTPPVVTIPGLLLSGQNLAAGTVLGQIASSGKYTAWTAGASDGSQKAVAVLCHDINASAGDANCEVYVAGCFNLAWLTFPNGTTPVAAAQVFNGSMIVARQLYWSNN